MPDYENDLVFKPAMTWEELCEYAKEKRALIGENWFNCVNLFFHKDGSIYSSDNEDCIGRNVSYERMKNIIDNLYGE